MEKTLKSVDFIFLCPLTTAVLVVGTVHWTKVIYAPVHMTVLLLMIQRILPTMCTTGVTPSSPLCKKSKTLNIDADNSDIQFVGAVANAEFTFYPLAWTFVESCVNSLRLNLKGSVFQFHLDSVC